MYRYFLALRYLLSRPINLLGMAGVMLGVWALIVVVSIFSGFIKEVRHHVQSATSDITVWRLPWPASYGRLEKAIAQDPNVAACAPRLMWYGLLHPPPIVAAAPPPAPPLGEPGAESRFIMVMGIAAVSETGVTGLRDWLAAVDLPALRVADPQAPLAPLHGVPAILLSQKRLERERVPPGTVVELTTARMEHSFAGENIHFVGAAPFAVAGAYSTLHSGFDAVTTFVDIDVLRALLAPGEGDVVNEVAVRLKDQSRGLETAARLQRTLQEAGYRHVLVHTWDQRNTQFLSAVDHQRGLMKLVLFVIMVVATFLMYATLSMMVTEKTHDIGILTAMGAPPSGVLQVFLSCGLAITIAGTLLGLLLGALSSIYLDDFNIWMRTTFGIDLFPTDIYNLKHVPHDLDPLWFAQVTALSLCLGSIVSGIPAWRAARHDPLESLRNE